MEAFQAGGIAPNQMQLQAGMEGEVEK